HERAVLEEGEKPRLAHETREVVERGTRGHQPGRRGEDLSGGLERGGEHPGKRERPEDEQQEAARVDETGSGRCGFQVSTSSSRNIRKYTKVAASSIPNMITARAAPMPAWRYVKLRAYA